MPTKIMFLGSLSYAEFIRFRSISWTTSHSCKASQRIVSAQHESNSFPCKWTLLLSKMLVNK